ncbi:MAG TPA: hypothetical protein VGO47_07760 [Chlamydiales bacterium]|nr:hypothetical protein [Chlamydiales bacterium]
MAGLEAISQEGVSKTSNGNYQDIVTMPMDRNDDDNAALMDETEGPAEGNDVFALGALGKVCSWNIFGVYYSKWM